MEGAEKGHPCPVVSILSEDFYCGPRGPHLMPYGWMRCFHSKHTRVTSEVESAGMGLLLAVLRKQGGGMSLQA